MSAEMTTCGLAIQKLCYQLLLKGAISFCFPTSFHPDRPRNCKGNGEAQPSCGCPDPVAKAGTCTYRMIC